MENIELTVVAENEDEKALHKSMGDLQRLQDLPSSRIDVFLSISTVQFPGSIAAYASRWQADFMRQNASRR